jgi:hypothetical protein
LADWHVPPPKKPDTGARESFGVLFYLAFAYMAASVGAVLWMLKRAGIL